MCDDDDDDEELRWLPYIIIIIITIDWLTSDLNTSRVRNTNVKNKQTLPLNSIVIVVRC